MRWIQLGRIIALPGLLACGEPLGSPSELGAAELPLLDGSTDTSTTGVVAVLGSLAGQWYFRCSGTLIAPDTVLTADHCVSLWTPSQSSVPTCEQSFASADRVADALLVVTGGDVTGSEAPGAANAHRVERVIAPPSQHADDSICGNDVAMLVLERAVPASDAEPIALRLESPVVDGEVVAAIGFGSGPAAPDRKSRTRLSGSVSCAGASCSAEEEVYGTEWLSEDISACAGDSGGPALDASGRVAGVLSRGFAECASVVYTDVYSWRHFVCDASAPSNDALEHSVRGCDALRHEWANDAPVARCSAGHAPRGRAHASAWYGPVLALLLAKLRRARRVAS